MASFTYVKQIKGFLGLTSKNIKSRRSWAKDQLQKFIKLSYKSAIIQMNKICFNKKMMTCYKIISYPKKSMH